MNEIVKELAAGPLKCILGPACKGYPAIQGSCFYCHALDATAKWAADRDVARDAVNAHAAGERAGELLLKIQGLERELAELKDAKNAKVPR